MSFKSKIMYALNKLADATEFTFDHEGVTILVGCAIVYEGAHFYMTGTLNPVKNIKHDIAHFQEAGVAQIEQERKFDEAYSMVLYCADRDHNHLIDFAEQADAWRRMGFRGPFYRPFLESAGASQFPTPTLGQLEEAIERYKREGSVEIFNPE